MAAALKKLADTGRCDDDAGIDKCALKRQRYHAGGVAQTGPDFHGQRCGDAAEHDPAPGAAWGESTQAYQFQDIDENINRIWTDIYEKEFRQFFQIPQLGLMRTYQEKANQAVDKYNLFQSTLSEFLSLLGLPFTRSVQVMQEKNE